MVELFYKIIIPIFCVITIRNPTKGFLLFLFLSPFTTQPIFSFGFLIPDLTFDRVGIICLLIGIFKNYNIKKYVNLTGNKFEISIIVFATIFLFEIAIFNRPKDSMIRILSAVDIFILPFLLYFIAKILMIESNQANSEFFFKSVSVLHIAGVIMAGMAIYEGLTIIDLLPGRITEYDIAHGGGLRTVGGYPRANGPYENPETLGMVISLIFLSIVSQMSLSEAPKIKFKYYNILSLIILAVGLYYNLFRSIWLGLFLALVIRSVYDIKTRKYFFAGIVVASIILVISLRTIIGSDMYKERLGQADTFYSRVGAYLYALRAFKENPIFGIGFNRLPKYIEHAMEDGDIIYVKNTKSANYAHNTFLSLLSEGGIIVLIAYIYIFCNLIKSAKYKLLKFSIRSKYKNEIRCLNYSLIASYIFPMFFDRVGYYGKVNNIFFILIGLMFGYISNNDKKISLKKKYIIYKAISIYKGK